MNINATLLGEMITFIILIWITFKFIWPPIIKAMEERKQKIADGLHAAERGERILVLSKEKVTNHLARAKQQAAQIIYNAQLQASKLVEEGRTKGLTDAQSILKTAEQDVKHQLAKTRATLREETANLIIASTEKLLRKTIDQKTHDQMLNELINEIK